MAYEDLTYTDESQIIGTDHAGNAYSAHVDSYTRALNCIDNNHHECHEGHAFTAFKKVTIANAQSNTFTLTTPANVRLHLKPATISSDGPKITYELWEGVTTTDGNAITPYNHNRNMKATTSGVVVKSEATFTGGTQIDGAYIGGGTGTGSTRSGADASLENEWVLEPATKYAIKIVNGGSSNADVMVSIFWYQH